jgi:hypothetical protein
MSDITDYKCAAGFYCNGGNTQYEPDGELDSASKIIGDACPVEYECSYGMMHKMKCSDGYISQTEGLPMCSACPSGFFCDIV